MPRSLDKDGRPPSPVFSLPQEMPRDKEPKLKSNTPFLGSLGRFSGGGLEDSIHNPERKEKQPLLERERDRY